MAPESSTPGISRFRAEYGGSLVGTACPRLSWTVGGAEDWRQQSYELREDADSLPIDSSESLFVPWPFTPLRSREQRLLTVRAHASDGRQTDWSSQLKLEAGLLEPSDWQAAFVGPAQATAPQSDEPCPFVRREFTLEREVTSARLYVSALGVFEPYLNGTLVGDEVLAPNWTSYHHRLRYQAFDVTGLLRPGRNAIGAILADGWYRGRLGVLPLPAGRRNIFGDRLALIAQLEIEFEDGERQLVTSDESWRTSTGPLLASSIYDGEHYDARRELTGWAQPGYDDDSWQPVQVVEHPLQTLVVPSDPPIRRTEEITPVDILRSPSGKLIVDFGQNLVGRVRIRVEGESGQTITIRHAEVLDGGELALQPLRSARAEDVYVLKGDGAEVWEPRFTFHGFRYVQIDDWPGEFDPERVVAVVLHTDFERTGWFQCSNQLINRLHDNAVWSLRGNFVGLPTDCPQRDERFGWGADLQVFTPAACSLYDVGGFLASWLSDLAAEQSPEGRVPSLIPNPFVSEPGTGLVTDPANPFAGPEAAWTDGDPFAGPVAAWGDAAVIVPWVLYQRFGDLGLLAAQWPSIRAYVDYLDRHVGPTRVWDDSIQLGDWLDPTGAPDSPGDGQTPTAIVASAYFARSALLASQAAEVLGFADDARRFHELAEQVGAAFRGAFMDPFGNMRASSMTAQALVLGFSLAADEDQRRRARDRLRQIIRVHGERISAGFVGAALICDALSDAGDVDLAYRLLTQTEFPSWLYQVKQGATTFWERWDSLLPDGTINPGTMTSFNHYAFGSVVDWLHRVVAGIELVEPGYRKIRFRPRPGGGLTHVSARHNTPYGPAGISWRLDGGRLAIEFEVPPNTSAEVVLPDGSSPFEVGSGSHRADAAYELHG